MMVRDICVGNTYEGKSGLRRKVNRWRVTGATASGYVGDVYYTPIDRNGKSGKARSCWSETFREWAVKEVTVDADEKAEG